MAPIEAVPGPLIEIGRLWTLVLNHNQSLLGKCMIVLNREETDAIRLTDEEWNALHHQTVRVKAALDSLFRPDHYNYAFLMNQDAQVHLHVIPRYEGTREWEGLQFHDADFGSISIVETRVLDLRTLSRLSATISAALTKVGRPGKDEGAAPNS